MILLRIALRNILATRVRTFIIGLLVTFGTALVVLGGSLLSSLEQSMARSITGSVSGNFQVYSQDARDELELFAPPVGTPRIGEIKDFPRVKSVLEKVEGVKTVVPMGTDNAIVFSGNLMDILLGKLREAHKSGDAEATKLLTDQIRRNVGLMKSQVGNLDGFVSKTADFDMQRKLADLDQAASPDFWAGFADDFETRITFLENRIAQLAMDERMLFLSYIGTDTEEFTQNFGLFEVVKGQAVPPGQRGFLFSDFIYERQVKHLIAGRLDRIREKLETGLTIAADKALANMIQQNVRQYKDILYQMDTDASARVLAELRTFLGSNEQEPIPLLQQFLAMDDGNFQERYDFFYRVIAPTIILYQVRIGDTLTIQSFTRRGYPTQVVVKVYGTYRFTGLEKSALAGLYNLMDLMTFRDLFGASTEESRIENEALKKKGGVADVKKEDAEAALFSDDSEPQEEEGSSALLDEYAGVDMKAGGRRFTQDLFDKVYTREEIDTGVTPNAAIVLDAGADERKAAEGISAAIAAENLGLKMVDWKKASGLVGQFIDVIWIVLVVAILIIFLVALVIINNSMLMATLDRTREIGTMRAIGAGRSYVLKMFLIESSVLGLGFGILGLLLGSGIVALLNALGIPAVTDELYFLFAGPRLRPVLLPSHLAVAFVVVFIVSVLSTLYPARIATRVAPVKAMGKED